MEVTKCGIMWTVLVSVSCRRNIWSVRMRLSFVQLVCPLMVYLQVEQQHLLLGSFVAIFCAMSEPSFVLDDMEGTDYVQHVSLAYVIVHR